MSDINIFLDTATIQYQAKSYLNIHSEVRAIENAVLVAASAGEADAIVNNTLMTNTTVNNWLTITEVNLSNSQLTITSHGYVNGAIIQFGTTSTLPAPLILNTFYYVNVVDADTFTVSDSYINYLNGVIVPLTTGGTGSQITQQAEPSQLYFAAWRGVTVDRPKTTEMNQIIAYFQSLGYSILRVTNPTNNLVFYWQVSW